jgi:nicotinamidase-related amidase
MSTNSAALVVLDGQNDFLTKGGVFYDAIQRQDGDENLVDSINAWIETAHQRDVGVINTHIVFDEGYPIAGDSPYGIFAAVKESGGFLRNTWGAETAEGLRFGQHDKVFEKPGMSAFLNPEFEQELERTGVRTLILAGLLSDACVECTMRTAYDKGYEVRVADRATRTLDPAKHAATVEQSFPLFSKTIELNEL